MNLSTSSNSSESTEEKNLFNVVKEGQAAIQVPKGNKVFYNKVQVTNRDLSIAVIKQFAKLKENEDNERGKKKHQRKHQRKHQGKQQGGHQAKHPETPFQPQTLKLSILEALSASGLRSIRYFKEIPNIKQILVNDNDPQAVKTIRSNIKFNDLNDDIVIPSLDDACSLMHKHKDQKKSFHIIDIDPYGSASMFLDSAVQAVCNGGLLCITCTDMGVLCGKDPEACYARYGSTSIKARYCHEMALRVLLNSLDRHANSYKRYIVPLISLSIDFYVRVFVRVFEGARETKNSCTKAGLVYQCVSCQSFHIQKLARVKKAGKNLKYSCSIGPPVSQKCPDCGMLHQVGGPIWTESLHDVNFAKLVIQELTENSSLYTTHKKLVGMLTTASEELPNSPLYYSIPDLASTLHANTPKYALIRSALINAGFEVSQAHPNPKALKTNAPNSAVWDVMRCWVQKNPVKMENISERSPARTILAVKPKLQADFTIVKGTSNNSKNTKVFKFLPNPEENWGPGTRAGKTKSKKRKSKPTEDDQGKRKKKPCRFWKAKQTCSYGEKCRYTHDNPNAVVTESKQEETTMDTTDATCVPEKKDTTTNTEQPMQSSGDLQADQQSPQSQSIPQTTTQNPTETTSETTSEATMDTS